jgi:hypothetical protein
MGNASAALSCRQAPDQIMARYALWGDVTDKGPAAQHQSQGQQSPLDLT